MTRPMRHVALLWMSLIISISFPLLAHANGKGKWLRKEVKGPAPDFTLTDQDGQKVSLRDLRGKVAVINFIYTSCATGCPLTTAKLRDIHEAFKGKNLQLVSVSFDPDHDTPEVLKEYAKRFKVDLHRWSFLTGTRDEIEKVLFDYKIEVQRRGKKGPGGEILSVAIVDHGLKSYVIDRAGMKKFEYWGQDFDPKAVMKDLEKLLDERR